MPEAPTGRDLGDAGGARAELVADAVEPEVAEVAQRRQTLDRSEMLEKCPPGNARDGGEIRDRETAATCLKAAETGHLVISAIHTPDAVSTIQRYVGLFEPDAQDVIRERLGDCLQAVVSLRLLVAKEGRRRLPAVEILRVTRTIRECIRSGGRLADIPDMIKKGRDLYSMQLFDQHLLDLVNTGLISMETAIYASSNPEELERNLRIE